MTAPQIAVAVAATAATSTWAIGWLPDIPFGMIMVVLATIVGIAATKGG